MPIIIYTAIYIAKAIEPTTVSLPNGRCYNKEYESTESFALWKDSDASGMLEVLGLLTDPTQLDDMPALIAADVFSCCFQFLEKQLPSEETGIQEFTLKSNPQPAINLLAPSIKIINRIDSSPDSTLYHVAQLQALALLAMSKFGSNALLVVMT